MDFSAQNPTTVNSLSLAARKNDLEALERLLKSGRNINVVDNRGWTAIHEAAANDCPEALEMILNHDDTRPLVETFEGQTALYLACRNKCSMKTINLLLQRVENIVEYASNEMVSPLHIVCGQGRLDAAEALMRAGAILNLLDYDGDSPLHEAARGGHAALAALLLHAGAEPGLRNSFGLTPFLLSCHKGSLACVSEIFQFVNDVNECAYDGNTGLIIAAQKGCLDVAKYLLENDANPDLENHEEALPLYIALMHGQSKMFQLLLPVTDPSRITRKLMNYACKPLYFSMDIIIKLLESNLGPEFFNTCDRFHVILEKIFGFRPRYRVNPPLCSILHVTEYIYKSSAGLCGTLLLLFLSKGVAVNALYQEECPPLVYLHYCEHYNSHPQVIQILVSHGCNVDYSTVPSGKAHDVPDALIASITSNGHTLPLLLTYSIKVEPDHIIECLLEHNMIGTRISHEVVLKVLPMCNPSRKTIDLLNKQLESSLMEVGEVTPVVLSGMLVHRVPSLKHSCRYIIRNQLRQNVNTTEQFLNGLKILPLPQMLKLYLRFM